jgi:hypothetical protein
LSSSSKGSIGGEEGGARKNQPSTNSLPIFNVMKTYDLREEQRMTLRHQALWIFYVGSIFPSRDWQQMCWVEVVNCIMETIRPLREKQKPSALQPTRLMSRSKYIPHFV